MIFNLRVKQWTSLILTIVSLIAFWVLVIIGNIRYPPVPNLTRIIDPSVPLKWSFFSVTVVSIGPGIIWTVSVFQTMRNIPKKERCANWSMYIVIVLSTLLQYGFLIATILVTASEDFEIHQITAIMAIAASMAKEGVLVVWRYYQLPLMPQHPHNESKPMLSEFKSKRKRKRKKKEKEKKGRTLTPQWRVNLVFTSIMFALSLTIVVVVFSCNDCKKTFAVVEYILFASFIALPIFNIITDL